MQTCLEGGRVCELHRVLSIGDWQVCFVQGPHVGDDDALEHVDLLHHCCYLVEEVLRGIKRGPLVVCGGVVELSLAPLLWLLCAA